MLEKKDLDDIKYTSLGNIFHNNNECNYDYEYDYEYDYDAPYETFYTYEKAMLNSKYVDEDSEDLEALEKKIASK